MPRALALALLVLALPGAAPQAQTVVLHIKVVLADDGQAPTPVPHHALLISENPASATPRQIVTALDGTADVKLKPGNYTVESDKPVTFHGKAYQWTQMLNVPAGRDTTLELTVANAEVGPAPAEAVTTPGASLETDPSLLLPQWQESVVAIWTPTTRTTGFVIDARGLLATNQRAVGNATSVEMQFTPTQKVAANVVYADPARDVAVLRIDPSALGSAKAVSLGCGDTTPPTVSKGQEIYTIGVPRRQQKGMTSGTVDGVEAHAIRTDLILAPGAAGGPVFAAGGAVIGITATTDESEDRNRGNVRIVPAADACVTLSVAEKSMATVPSPGATHLPVEPADAYPLDALRAAIKGRAGSLSPYPLSSAEFDIGFITPVMTFGAQSQLEDARKNDRSGGRAPDADQGLMRTLTDFGAWSDYVADFPPVLLVRVTPRFTEGFWTTVGRAAARTQGVALPAFKRYKSGFGRMRAFCGETEVTPIHPFRIEREVSETSSIVEGLYVYDPAALSTKCGTVKLQLYSEKEPDKADTRVVDPALLQQIARDFEGYHPGK
jgi:S1-C subfamily serine protease